MSDHMVNKQSNPGATILMVVLGLVAAAATFVLLVVVPPAAALLGLTLLGLCVWQRHRQSGVAPVVVALTTGVFTMVLGYVVLAASNY